MTTDMTVMRMMLTTTGTTTATAMVVGWAVGMSVVGDTFVGFTPTNSTK